MKSQKSVSGIISLYFLHMPYILNKMTTFKFTEENLQLANEAIARYPQEHKKSAVMPLLDLTQRQNDNWLSKKAMEYVADMLDMPYIRVYEVASFYSMYNLKPVGKTVIKVCTTASCQLKGGEKILEALKKHLEIELNETTKDGKYTLKECECLGACANAPVIQVNDEYWENVTLDDIKKKLV